MQTATKADMPEKHQRKYPSDREPPGWQMGPPIGCAGAIDPQTVIEIKTTIEDINASLGTLLKRVKHQVTRSRGLAKHIRVYTTVSRIFRSSKFPTTIIGAILNDREKASGPETETFP